MIRSQPILPIRFYNDYYDMDRFRKFRDKRLETFLNYPQNALPAFQITRPQSLAEPSQFYLIEACNDRVQKLLSESESNFGMPYAQLKFNDITIGGIVDNGVDPPVGVAVPAGDFSCGVLKSVDPVFPAFFTKSNEANIVIGSSVGNLVSFKIIVEKFHAEITSNFKIKIFNDSTLVDEITSTGIFTYYFLCAGDIKIEFDEFDTDDYYEISFVQATVELFSNLDATDIELDPSALEINNTASLEDIISYCEDTVYPVTPGQYFYAIKFSDGSYYYSEIFFIKSQKELQYYYRLRWWNDDDYDLEGIFYDSTVLGCDYRNILYLDAELFKPEYDTVIENTTDGENTLIPTFKKWQKSVTLDIRQTPEFLADALSAIFLHDNIYLQEPINKLQENQGNEYQVIEVKSEVAAILQDYTQRVLLKMLLSQFYVKNNCKKDVDLFACDSVYAVKVADDPDDADYYLVDSMDVSAGVFSHDGDVLLEDFEPTKVIFDFDSGFYYKWEKITGVWQKTQEYPTIDSIALGTGEVEGYVLPNTFAVVEYNKNAAGWIAYNAGAGLASSTGQYLATYDLALLVGATDFDIRVKNITRDCIYGTTSVHDIG